MKHNSDVGIESCDGYFNEQKYCREIDLCSTQDPIFSLGDGYYNSDSFPSMISSTTHYYK